MSDGRYFRAGKKSDLFIMTKVDPSTPGVDGGWIYGTVSADGKTVIAQGQSRRARAATKACRETGSSASDLADEHSPP
jgi:hypothetical protein